MTISLTSMLAHSTLYGQPGLPNNVGFLKIEGERLQTIVAPWFGMLFWATGAFSLFGSAMGITDYTSRLTADVVEIHLPAGFAGDGEPPVFLAGVGPRRPRVRHHPDRA